MTNPLTPERLSEIKARCEAIRVKDFELPAMVHEFLLLVPDCLAEIERLQRENGDLERRVNTHKDLLDVVGPLLEAYWNMAQTLQSDLQFQGDQLTQRAKAALAKGE